LFVESPGHPFLFLTPNKKSLSFVTDSTYTYYYYQFTFEFYPSLGFVVRVGWMKCSSRSNSLPQFSIQGYLGFVSDSTIWNDLGCSATEKALQSAVHLGIFASNLAESDNGFNLTTAR